MVWGAPMGGAPATGAESMATETKMYSARELPWGEGPRVVAAACRERAEELKRYAAIRLARGEVRTSQDYEAEGRFWLRAAAFVELSGPVRFREMARIAAEGI